MVAGKIKSPIARCWILSQAIFNHFLGVALNLAY